MEAAFENGIPARYRDPNSREREYYRAQASLFMYTSIG